MPPIACIGPKRERLTGTVVLVHDKRRILIPTPVTYDDATLLILKYLPSISEERIRILSRIPGCPDGVDEETEITAEVWHIVAPVINQLTVVDAMDDSEEIPDQDVEESSANSNTRSNIPSRLQARARLPPPLQLFVKLVTGKTATILFYPSDTIATIKERIEILSGVTPSKQRLIYAGKQLQDDKTCAYHKIEKESTLHLMLRLKGGKPVIYLYPPSVLTATVSLSLIPQWRFSALYPFTPITAAKVGTETGEALVWVVTAHPDGTLRQEPSGVDTSYLLWEAETHLDLLDSPPSSPTSASLPSDLTSDCDDTESFIPGRSKCAPHNSVLLSVQEAPLYLNKALFELALHTEARTSFITYWLSSLLKHQFIALRFVPQSAYEKAAPLDISPTPDLVTRVFMLFQGVSPLEVDDSVWQEAENRAKDPPSIWNNVVGIDEAKQEDEKLFRVLEWGGMEVY